jgi:hypothetical protein
MSSLHRNLDVRRSNGNSQLRALCGRGIFALLGITLALLGSGLLETRDQANDVLVWVNQYPITAEQLAFVSQRLADASPDELGTEQRQSILNLLVDEELLLQRAESLGFQNADPGIRKALVQAVIDRVVADFLSQPVDTRQLRHFFQQHRAVFERPLRIAVDVLRFESSLEAERAHAALMAGADFADIGNTFEAEILSYLPSSPLPAHMLRRYLGSTLTNSALTLNQGEISNPIQRPDGAYLLRARQVTPVAVPKFDEVRVHVESEYRRRGRDKALDDTLVDLWNQADIEINASVIDDPMVANDRRLVQLQTISGKSE